VPDVLDDASALVALLDADAAQHARAVEALKALRDPVATV
jgi:predicted nucleic acid-binding protein